MNNTQQTSAVKMAEMPTSQRNLSDRSVAANLIRATNSTSVRIVKNSGDRK